MTWSPFNPFPSLSHWTAENQASVHPRAATAARPHSLRLISISASSDSSGGLVASTTSGTSDTSCDHGFNWGSTGVQLGFNRGRGPKNVPNIWWILLWSGPSEELALSRSYSPVTRFSKSAVLQFFQNLQFLLSRSMDWCAGNLTGICTTFTKNRRFSGFDFLPPSLGEFRRASFSM